jgi:transposase
LEEQEMKKILKQAYTTEFKELAVKRVADGQAVVATTKELGLGEQTLRNWVKAAAAGKLKGAYGKSAHDPGTAPARLHSRQRACRTADA